MPSFGEGCLVQARLYPKNPDFYGAKETQPDFGDAGAPPIINSWVKLDSSGKTDRIVEQLAPDAAVYPISAISSTSKPQVRSHSQKTPPQRVLLPGPPALQHPRMRQLRMRPHLESEQCQGISFAGGHGRLSLYVLSPRGSHECRHSATGKNAESWQKWVRQFQCEGGSLVLTRFKMQYDMWLNDARNILGMGVAEDRQRADFSGMTPAQRLPR